MASSGALADFSKRPPAFKAGVFAAIAVVLGALYYYFVFAKIRRDIKKADREKGALIADQKKYKTEIVEYGQLKEQATKLEAIIKENSSALPTAAQLPGFFDLLNQQVKEAGVEVRRWDYEKELPVEDMFKVPVEISIAGTYFEIEHFFYLLYKVSQKSDPDAPADVPATPTDPTQPATPGTAASATKLQLEERGRILTIENLVIDQPIMENNELVLVATFRAATFRKDAPVVDEEAEAKDKKALDKKAKTKAKGKAGELEEKTEKAMDKSDARSREAGGADSPVPATRDDKPEAGGADAVKKGM